MLMLTDPEEVSAFIGRIVDNPLVLLKRLIEFARNNFLGGDRPLAQLGDSEAIRLDDNSWDIHRAEAVLARIMVNKRSAVTLERQARKRFTAPRRPAVVAHASKTAARDRSFRWYAELEHLVGL
jgi:hypothetical protein